MPFIVREGKVAVLFQQGVPCPCADALATPFDTKEEAWQAAQQHFTAFTVEHAPLIITCPPPPLKFATTTTALDAITPPQPENLKT